MKHSACLYAFMGISLLLIFSPCSVFAQERDFAEQQLDIDRAGISGFEGQVAPAPGKVLIDKEEKYVAGNDGVWFTDDDAIYEYYMIEHDAEGKIFKKSCFKAGKDMVPYNYDDQLQNFQLFEYGLNGKLLKETSFDGQSAKQFAKQYTVVYKYDRDGKKIKTIRYDSRGKEIRSMTFEYDPAENVVKDVEYVGKGIEKYHRFEYDGVGKVTLAMEYHAEHNGKGPDGVWFTPDDAVSSTKEFIYNSDSTKSQDNKYISSGPDGAWFTDDDQLQYYVLFEFQEL